MTLPNDDPLDLSDAEYQELIDGVAELTRLTAQVVEAERSKSETREAKVKRLREHLAKLNNLADGLEAKRQPKGSAWPGAIIMTIILLMLAFLVAPRISPNRGPMSESPTPQVSH